MTSVEAIHARALVLDAHADIEIPGRESRYVADDGRSKVDPAKMRAGGVDAVVMSVAVTPVPRDRAGFEKARRVADAKLATVRAMTGDPSMDVVLARSADEVIAAKESGKPALILGFQNALIAGNDLDTFDEFHAAGVRLFALTHMGHNDFADSSRPIVVPGTAQREPTVEHGGLSGLGREAIARINRLGSLVDVSQLSQQATMQAIECSTAPVVASHSNVRALCDVSRNLSDVEIDAIAACGGVVHVSPFRGYLFDSTDDELVEAIRSARRSAGLDVEYLYPYEQYWEIGDPVEQLNFTDAISDLLGPGRLNDVVDHIAYVVDRVGIDHVGIGTDFNQGGGIEGFDDASEALGLTAALVGRGFGEHEIGSIWSGNFLRAMRAAAESAG